MIYGLNRICLLGRLGSQPLLKISKNNNGVFTNFSLATSERVMNGDKNNKHTEWHKLVIWGSLAESVCRDLKIGSLVYVEGCVRAKRTADKYLGQKYYTEVHVKKIIYLESVELTEKRSSKKRDKREKESYKEFEMPEIFSY